ncbi:SDR family NAD(P)-dependent oxidoreductase [Pseudomonas sp. CDFA 602]|uniref:SDR family NAD(P)-dependent oxidoreductase n=1 Tax=Pseudomonas californiensis TaxID=2829823 RepID=UPI001E4E8F9F|nr:SDR family NAD(P)-dependent oxidoreductase [Pseudomonas californiensis]MCD5992455.1 SDR family NAD(P)-dependent oxidoreductase [Pseudomonas californiensis]MCD5998267.1 SDR family NAD(P)-dependent oxidoreductase [Pseudomonas californiensis]
MKTYVFKECVVAITGGTGGRGLAMAKAIRAKDVRIALLDLNGAVVGEQARELGGTDITACWQADVCTLESVETAMASGRSAFRGIDVAIASAGVYVLDYMATMDPCQLSVTPTSTSTASSVRYVRRCRERRKGYMMAISSMAAFIHGPLNGHYAANKAGVWALCDRVRLEVRHLGVGVGTVYPKFFKTPMMDAVKADPIGNNVWNGKEKGLWKTIGLDEVVNIVKGIERRWNTVIIPKRDTSVAWLPSMFRRVVEGVGFKKADIVETIRLAQPTRGGK